jgi:hypothetical protein
LAAAFNEAFKDFHVGDDFEYYDQLVPKGYQGSLIEYRFSPPTEVEVMFPSKIGR